MLPQLYAVSPINGLVHHRAVACGMNAQRNVVKRLNAVEHVVFIFNGPPHTAIRETLTKTRS